MYDVKHGGYPPDEKKTESDDLRLEVFKKNKISTMVKIMMSDREINNSIL